MPFIEIVRPLLRMAEEGLQSPDRPVRFTVEGDGGKLPATVATPLSVVLTELLQNAVDHGFPATASAAAATSWCELDNDGRQLRSRSSTTAPASPDGFTLDNATGLGLSIVRTLVTTELAGTIDMRTGPRPRHSPGTVVALNVPVGDGTIEPHDPPLLAEGPKVPRAPPAASSGTRTTTPP